jgi:hypothetical protein
MVALAEVKKPSTSWLYLHNRIKRRRIASIETISRPIGKSYHDPGMGTLRVPLACIVLQHLRPKATLPTRDPRVAEATRAQRTHLRRGHSLYVATFQ